MIHREKHFVTSQPSNTASVLAGSYKPIRTTLNMIYCGDLWRVVGQITVQGCTTLTLLESKMGGKKAVENVFLNAGSVKCNKFGG